MPLFANLLLLTTSAAAWAQTCSEASTDAQVAANARAAAEAFFVTAEQSQFEAAVSVMRSQLICLGEPIAPETAASVHLAAALEALVQGQEEDIVLALHAARAASPDFALSEEQAPPGNPLRLAYEQAGDRVLSDTASASRPECVSLWVDGHQSEAWVAGRPAVVQLSAPGGAILSSGYVAPGAAPASTAYACPGARVSDDSQASLSAGRRLLLGSGAVLAAGSAGAFTVMASRARADWLETAALIAQDDPLVLEPTSAEVTNFSSTLPSHTKRFSAAALGAGVVAVGLGATLVVTW